MQAALIDETLEFHYATREIRLTCSRIIAVTTMVKGIKKRVKGDRNDDEQPDESERMLKDLRPMLKDLRPIRISRVLNAS